MKEVKCLGEVLKIEYAQRPLGERYACHTCPQRLVLLDEQAQNDCADDHRADPHKRAPRIQLQKVATQQRHTFAHQVAGERDGCPWPAISEGQNETEVGKNGNHSRHRWAQDPQQTYRRGQIDQDHQDERRMVARALESRQQQTVERHAAKHPGGRRF